MGMRLTYVTKRPGYLFMLGCLLYEAVINHGAEKSRPIAGSARRRRHSTHIAAEVILLP
jgi:hypothetical protein